MSKSNAPQIPSPRSKPASLSQAIVERLSGQMASGRFRPGDQLPTESELAREHGVSRTVVREAMSQLRERGLIERRQGAGTFVLTPPPRHKPLIDPELELTVQDLLQLLQLRASLESESAALAALHRTPEQLQQISETHRLFLQALQEGRDNTAHDARFHLLLAEATGNRYFLDFINHLGNALIPRNHLRSARLSTQDRASLLNRIGQEHEDIYHAIVRQDADAARTAMRMHLINSRLRILKLLEPKT